MLKSGGAQIGCMSGKPYSFIRIYLKYDMVVNEHGGQDDAQNIQPSDSLIGMKKTETFTQEICKT